MLQEKRWSKQWSSSEMKDNNEGADTNGKLMEQFSKAQGSSLEKSGKQPRVLAIVEVQNQFRNDCRLKIW